MRVFARQMTERMKAVAAAGAVAAFWLAVWVFAAATQLVGTTPSNAIRMFIAAFNRCGTFPFDISPNGAFGAAPDSHQ